MATAQAFRTDGVDFGAAGHGVRWALSSLPEGAAGEVAFGCLAGAQGPDDHAVRFSRGGIRVLANSAIGAIGGVLAVGDQLRGGERRSASRRLQFRTRNYKLEISFAPGSARSIWKWEEGDWEAFFQQVVRHQFNGVVFYCGNYHPFEQFLDYAEWPGVSPCSDEERAGSRSRFAAALAMAHRYGLTTFMQHYVGHFPAALGQRLGIRTTGRHSAVEHPEIERYSRYCYRETFRQLPDLDGLYFNFESWQSAWRFVNDTAIPEFRAMARHPIFFCRLWGFTDPASMRKMMRAYPEGRFILCHKVSDTSDIYNYPRTDSRVREWKQALGPRTEFAYELGPCHNCATNLCSQLWGDYGFVQGLLADARRKGADSISFHSVHNFFAPDLPREGAICGAEEQTLARGNWLHLQAAVDFVNGRQLPPAGQAAALSARFGQTPAAGRRLRDAIEAASRHILLTYQQFCYGSASDGYINRGRYSHIQEPFYYYPVTELNDQHSRPMWHGFVGAWVPKASDVKVTPPNYTQRILDYVDPSKPRKATFHPGAVARQLEANLARSRRAFAAYERLAGREAADRLRPYLDAINAGGDYVRHEIRAAIALYSLYFARQRLPAVRALRKGIEELRANLPPVQDRAGHICRTMERMYMLKPLDPGIELAEAEETLRFVEAGAFPFAAYAAWLNSRRLYNEVRRVVRPGRTKDAQIYRHIRRCLAASDAEAHRALGLLAETGDGRWSANVRAWLAFVEQEAALVDPPAVACPAAPREEWHPLHHDHCFRTGENFVEDFSGFFKPIDWQRRWGLAFRVHHEPDALVVTVREEGVNIAERRETWEKGRKDESSMSFVTRILVAPQNPPRQAERIIVWPTGEMVNRNLQPNVGYRTAYSETERSWQVTVWIPFATLGGRPKAGARWGLNVLSNPFLKRHHSYAWSLAYDSNDPGRLGRIRFEG